MKTLNLLETNDRPEFLGDEFAWGHVMKHNYLCGPTIAAAHDLEQVIEVAKVIDDHIGASKFAVLRKFVRAVDHIRADIPELVDFW